MERQNHSEHKLRGEHIATHTETGEVLSLGDSCYETVPGTVRLGVYRHYKSTPDNPKYYVVMSTVLDTRSSEQYVVYGRFGDENGALYARPVNMFLDNVFNENNQVPRFRYISRSI